MKYGDWACDLSPALAASMFSAIEALEVTPDFILNTGDDPAHDVWAQTQELNLEAVRYVAALQQNMSFGGRRPIVNTFGNHANSPVNQFQGPGGDDWLYSGAAQAWLPWLSEDALRTLTFGGFYQMRVAPKLRAVVMHSTMFSGGESGNWFFTVNRTDVGAQFPWLDVVLGEARERGEKVLLLRHCPISDFDYGFDEMMRNVTESYSDVIVASFAGHSHTSWYTVQRDAATDRIPLDVTYVSGSGTPGGGNPTFRVFHYDLDTYEILDYDQYWVDMDQANANGRPEWKKDHSARPYYGLKDLSAASWERLARSWLQGADNMTSWQHYARAMTRNRRPAESQNRPVQACTALSVTSELYKQCMGDPHAELPTHADLGSSMPGELIKVLIGSQPVAQCSKCLDGEMTWCWKDSSCHLIGSLKNPCSNAQCASASKISACHCKTCGDAECSN